MIRDCFVNRSFFKMNNNEESKSNNSFFARNKNVILWTIFILYGLINLVLLFLHEPWRDELHAWIMAKKLSIPQLFSESRFDGHPILWHLILMPFAKLNFPVFTLNIISYVILLATVWLFLFKTKTPFILKAFATFFIPFTYIYSVISRNYCLILFFLVIIAVLYPKRFKSPILYSIPICFLVHTHSLAWGIVAGLTITFYFYEIYLWLRFKKNNANIKHVFIGLALIAFNSILVVLELFGSDNGLYGVNLNNSAVWNYVYLCSAILLVCFIFTFFVFKKNYKEFWILFFSFVFQFVVYLCFYSSILFQRQMLVYVILLFYIMLIFSDKENLISFKTFALSFLFVLVTVVSGFSVFFGYVRSDISSPFSGAIEMSNFINENVPKNSTIYVVDSVIGQSLIPYVGNDYVLYDIEHDMPIETANVYHDFRVLNSILKNVDSYAGNYILICNDAFDLTGSCDLIFSAKSSGLEDFDLYYVPTDE